MQFINPYKMFQGAFIPNALMECRDLSQSAKLMWARLAQYAGKDGRCFPSIDKLGDDIGLSRSMAKKVLKELQDYGLIKVKHASGKMRLMHGTSEYFFIHHPVFDHGHENGQIVSSGGSKNGPSVRTKNGPSKEGPKMDRPIEENQLRESELTSVPGDEPPDDDSQKTKKYHGTKEDHELAKKIYEAVLVVNSTIQEPSWDRWANDIRLMRAQDGRSHVEIWQVFTYANRDQFWCHNILSPAAIRRHYARLAPKAGMVRSQVRGVVADVIERDPGLMCGGCAFAGRGRKICGGVDSLPDHPACDLYRAAGGNES